MIRSTSKEVKEAVKTYIMDHFEDALCNYLDKNGKVHSNDLQMLETVNINNYKEVCTAIFEIFKAEKITKDQRYKAGRISMQDLFIDWCYGLCSAIDTSYCYNVSALDLLGNWLHQNEYEKSQYSESEAEIKISSIIYREIMQQVR